MRKPHVAEALLKMLRNGGSIVSTNLLSYKAIANADAEGRMFVDLDGFGYVYRADRQPIESEAVEEVKEELIASQKQMDRVVLTLLRLFEILPVDRCCAIPLDQVPKTMGDLLDSDPSLPTHLY